MTYLPGEKVQITVIGTVGRVVDGSPWSEIRLDVDDTVGGVALPIPLGWDAVHIIRLVPAAGVPKPGELWQDRDETPIFVTKDRHGNAQFTTADGRTHTVEWMNNQFGPLSPIRQLPKAEPEPDWTWDNDNESATDPSGKVWNLTVPYRDAAGDTWHWAGGYGRDGDEGPMRPLMSRDNYSRCDVQITDIPAPLTPLPVNEPGGGEG